MPKIDNNTQQPGYEYFKALVSNMPMIFYVLDQDGILHCPMDSVFKSWGCSLDRSLAFQPLKCTRLSRIFWMRFVQLIQGK